jgi:DNA-binding NtrC family response regulator
VGKPRILIAQPNAADRRTLEAAFLECGYDVTELSDPSRYGSDRSDHADLVILAPTDHTVASVLESVRTIRARHTSPPIVLIVPTGSEALAVAAFRAGVADYFRPPFSTTELVATADRLLKAPEHRRMGCESPRRKAEAMVGQSLSVQRILQYIDHVSATDSTVLVVGETGTGKELVANLIHRASARAARPLVSINCAAIPDSLFESELFGHAKGAFTGAHAANGGKLQSAQGGTVLLDEIGDMTPFAQAKILRVIETKEVYPVGGARRVPLDVRIIAATNHDLEQSVADGRFRKDLYFRLNVTGIMLPALRDRREDIPPLIRYYICDLNRRFGRQVDGFTEDAERCLLQYDWPGNVRELKNLLEAIYVNLPSGTISLVDLPDRFRRRFSETSDLPQTERDRLLSTLLSVNWNKSKAAAKLRWSRMTLYRKLAKYALGPARKGHA